MVGAARWGGWEVLWNQQKRSDFAAVAWVWSNVFSHLFNGILRTLRESGSCRIRSPDDSTSGLSRHDRAGPIWIGVSFVPIVLPIQRLEVTKIVASALGNWLDVVDLPTVLCGLSVLGPCDPGPAGVLAVA